MSHCVEFEDKNVEMAVKKACEELNIPRDKLKHDVISYGSTGIFGLVGTKKARIRVTLPEPSQTVVFETISNERKNENSGEQTAESVGPQIEISNDEIEDHRIADDPRDIGREALQKIIDLITEDATISIENGSNRIIFNVTGGNSAVLIGKRGQTLEAIQYLVEKIVNKNRKGRVGIHIDVEGYLEKRRMNLQRLALRMAEKVKSTGKPAAIGQMNAHDRRIVHIALQDDNMVRTQSKGEGFLKKLVIFPKKNSSRKQK
ncbi:MAG: RNA-binding cell elongation regulator Jag/EloR [Desulfobacterales bacterium]|jgi:spoIIIJ-associated protein